ncbi:MAG TPA: FAD:protein FMN transferase, partial [Acidobacteriota bacterium]
MSPHFALALAFEAGALLPGVEPTSSQLVERCAFVMGAPCEGAVLAASRGAGMQALEAAFGAIARLERLLSDYDPQSELSQLNRWPSGAPRTCSAELLSLLERARELQLETAGAFDPGIGALVRAWDLRGEGRVPAAPALARARSASGFALLAFELQARTATRLHPELQLDPGAFGKGAALDRAAEALRAGGSRAALLDFGGQVVALGSGPGGQEWRVAIADPGDRSRPIARLGLRDVSVATSGQSERGARAGDRILGHIVDPRSGAPVPAYG